MISAAPENDLLENARRILIEEVEGFQIAAEDHSGEDALQTLERAIVVVSTIQRFTGRRTSAELKERFSLCVAAAFREVELG